MLDSPAVSAPALDWEPLIAAARSARERAYAPYSRFRVGAALLASDGRVFAGCNVENRTFGLTVCAERSAVLQAVAAGAGKPVALAVVADASPKAPPCGMCRETLAEFADDLPILLVDSHGDREELRLAEIFPRPFVFPTGPR